MIFLYMILNFIKPLTNNFYFEYKSLMIKCNIDRSLIKKFCSNSD